MKNSSALLIEKLPYTTTLELEKGCKKLISVKFILGDIVQLKTRRLYKVIGNQPLWDSWVNLTNYEKAIKELIFLKNNIIYFSKKPLRFYDLPRIVIFSDASSFTTRSIFEKESGIYTCHKNLTTKEHLESSTWRELWAIKYAFKIFCAFITKHFNAFKDWWSLCFDYNQKR